MRKLAGALAVLFVLMSSFAFAADGDLIVNGKIGVSVTNPSENLEVNGVIKATGGFKFPDGTLQTTAAAGSVPIYKVTAAGCANVGALTIEAMCGTLTCNYYESTAYYTCGGSCGVWSSQSCNNTYIGKLMP
jgi:hypothetical protein